MISVVRKGNLMPVFSLFDEFVNNFVSDEIKNPNPTGNACSMPLDIREKENEYIIHAELPGIKKEKVKLSFQKHQLIIEAEAEEELVKENDKVHRRERFCGNFYRSIQLPEHIDGSAIGAKMENGLLIISIAKQEDKKQSYINIE
jgi:HSP20 family protein